MSMKDLPAADLESLRSADPALAVTPSELARSRARSMAVADQEFTSLAAGIPLGNYPRSSVKRRWGRLVGGFAAAAAVAAAVLTASLFQTAPEVGPAATAAGAQSQSPAAPTPSSQGQIPPSGPLRDLFASADEVIVLEALPNAAASSAVRQTALGVEPVNILQVLKGSHGLGKTSLDMTSGPLWWRNTTAVAPLTYLGFFTRGADGAMHLMTKTHSLVQIQNLRTAATVDPETDEPIDIGNDLRSRINVAPLGDRPVSTYAADRSGAAATDMILGTLGPGGSRDGLIRGHVTAKEACFTFENSTERVYLRWPVGYTAAIRPLPQDADGHVVLNGTKYAETPVILNEWGFIFAADGDPRPQVNGHLTGEKASCGDELLPVFEFMPERVGGSPFQKGRGVALPTP